MMDSEALLAAGNTHVLPGRKLAWFRNTMMAELASYFKNAERESLLMQAAALIRKAELRIKELPEIPGQERDPWDTDEGRSANAINGIIDNVSRTGMFNVGRQAFNNAAMDLANLPMLLWSSLHAADSKITIDEAKALITPENESKLQAALLELMGYFVEKKSGWVLDRKTIPGTLERLSNPSPPPENIPQKKSET
jgi:hypothetical protein